MKPETIAQEALDAYGEELSKSDIKEFITESNYIVDDEAVYDAYDQLVIELETQAEEDDEDYGKPDPMDLARAEREDQ